LTLRKGKTKNTLESSIDSALLAVEVYNKPRTDFKVENFILLMIIAWTKLLHAHFQNTIGDKYYYKKSNGRFVMVDGDRKAWELGECIKNCSEMSESIKVNLKFFIGLRNKIEHRYIEKDELSIKIFGESQSLLYNYESTLVNFFGEEYTINENLAYALQFSCIRTTNQKLAQKKMLSKEVQDLYRYIEKYRSDLRDEVFNSNEFSIKIIQIPKITNTNRNDLAIEFVNWNCLSEDDKENYNNVTALIKDKVIRQEVANYQKLKPSDVGAKVSERLGLDFKANNNTTLWKAFGIRPPNGNEDPFDTVAKYCIYDEPHKDYVYSPDWVEFVIKLFEHYGFTIDNINQKCRDALKINDYE